MKKKILLAAMVAIFATSVFAQTNPETTKKVAKLGKREDQITKLQTNDEVKKERKVTQKIEKNAHRQAMQQAKKDKKHNK